MKLTIDNLVVDASPGESLYQAAKRARIAIPGLCVSDHLAAFGSCRLCLCEIEGQSGTPASCTTPAQDGMVVRTNTERLRRHRRNILELYLSEQQDGTEISNALRRLSLEYGVGTVRYPPGAKRARFRDASNPFFLFDNSHCISCARCVRACDEIQGTMALTMIGRGFATRPIAGARPLLDGGPGFLQSNCVSCGACVKECPTGALMEKNHSGPGPANGDRPHDLRLLRRRLRHGGRGAEWPDRQHGSCRRWAVESRPCLHERSVRLDLCLCGRSPAPTDAAEWTRMESDSLGGGA